MSGYRLSPAGQEHRLARLRAVARERAVERFWRQVDRSQDCWLWRGRQDSRGYGKNWIMGESLAHRVAYRLVVGDVPAGLEIDHLCRTPLCVRPEHLEPVTHRVNVQRGMAAAVTGARGRAMTACKRGHPFDTANTRWGRGGHGQPAGRRHCRRCAREYMRLRRQQVRERFLDEVTTPSEGPDGERLVDGPVHSALSPTAAARSTTPQGEPAEVGRA